MNYIDIPNKLKGSEPVKNDKAITNALKNIISTPKGTVPGHPEFGCGMDQYIFETIDPMVKESIKAEILYAVGRWEPRVKITEIEVIDDPDYNRILIKMKYNILSDVKSNEYEYIFKQDLV